MRTIVCGLILLTGVAKGQVAELWLGGGTSVLTNRGIGSFTPSGTPEDVQLKGGFRINFRMGLNSTRFTGHEFGYAYNRTKLEISGFEDQGMAIHQGFYNYLLYATKEGFRIRPFATGGGHFSNFVPPGVSVTQGGGATKFGFNYGGGIKVRVTDVWGFRLDFRQYMTGKPFDLPLVRGLIRQNELSASIGFLLQ
jgi:opacity protein-like surface antigen